MDQNKCNESKTANKVERKFNNQPQYNVVVSDLTYVRVGTKWHYICVLIDLFNRKIIGHSCGQYKDAKLVISAFSTVKTNLGNINIFHTDRGNEFKNQAIDEVLKTFNIERSLSMKGCPYDNEELKYKLLDYVNWFNNHRIHSSLHYLSPKQYREKYFSKI